MLDKKIFRLIQEKDFLAMSPLELRPFKKQIDCMRFMIVNM